jgi:serine/threonine protein kinase
MQASAPGTVAYAAPELLVAGEASTASDIYSFGCLLLELLAKSEPWASGDVSHSTSNTASIVRAVTEGGEAPPLDGIPEDVRAAAPTVIEALERCLSFQPAVRPSAADVLVVLQDSLKDM